VKRLLSSDHFSVDGTLLEAWASIKSFRRKDGGDNDAPGPGRNAERNFHKEKRSNETHRSITDPEARLYRKSDGQPARLCYMGHALMENRNGLVVGGIVTKATGTAEREASEALLAAKVKETGKPATVGEDKAYDVKAHGANLEKIGVTAHVARNNATTKTGKQRTSIIDDAMAASEGYGMSQTRRKMIECLFGWGKQHGTLRKTKHRGLAQVTSDFLVNLIAYNLIRIPKLIGP
jgi:hypothetical protein